jgi:hypothetical protein
MVVGYQRADLRLIASRVPCAMVLRGPCQADDRRAISDAPHHAGPIPVQQEPEWTTSLTNQLALFLFMRSQTRMRAVAEAAPNLQSSRLSRAR